MKPIGSYYLERLPATTTQPAREVLYKSIAKQRTRMGYRRGLCSVLDKVTELEYPGQRFKFSGYWISASEAEMFINRAKL